MSLAAPERRATVSPPRAGPLATFSLSATVAAWVVVLVRVGTHRIYVSHDTLISYARSWYVASRLWHGHGIPLRMPIVAHGDGFTFPYGALPWTVAALLRPALGDWSTTLVLVTATVAMMATTFWAFPELAGGWNAVAVLIEPAMISSPIIGQIPFVTAAALLFGAIGAWRRERPGAAVLLAGIAQATHPLTVLPLAALLVAGRLRFEPRRARLGVCYLVSVALALPAVVLVVASPVAEETSFATKLAVFFGNLGPRCLLFVVPIALVMLGHRAAPRGAAPMLVAVLAAANLGLWSTLGMPWAWRALGRQPDRRMERFAESGEFRPAKTYRVLRVDDGKVGMYQLLRHGARLDSDFFPESIDWRSWPTDSAYRSFLRHRDVDFVMVWRGYDGTFHTNEHRLLSAGTAAGCRDGRLIRLVHHAQDFDLYGVDRCLTPITAGSG